MMHTLEIVGGIFGGAVVGAVLAIKAMNWAAERAIGKGLGW